jgi:hypothetical protein
MSAAAFVQKFDAALAVKEDDFPFPAFDERCDLILSIEAVLADSKPERFVVFCDVSGMNYDEEGRVVRRTFFLKERGSFRFFAFTERP